MTTQAELYLVGGAVRDYIQNPDIIPKDFDFAVVTESFDSMRTWLLENDFIIFLESPEYYTIRAKKKSSWTFASFTMSGLTYDFVLARKDGKYTDGRRPDKVYPGTIEDDLARRDFTINAIAIDKDGNFIDPFNGIKDIKNEVLRCVNGVERLYEDGLRILRAIRFQVTLDFRTDSELERALRDEDTLKYLENVSIDRIKDELFKAFKCDTSYTLLILSIYRHITRYIFEDTDLWLIPSLKKK